MRLLPYVREDKSQASISIHPLLNESNTTAVVHFPVWPQPSLPIIYLLPPSKEDRK